MNYSKCDQKVVDYKSAMERFFNDEDLYGQAVNLFINSPILANLKVAYDSKDYETIFKLAHELKGASGNLSFIELYDAASELTETVRNGMKNLEEFEKAYSLCIEKYNQTLRVLKSA